MDQVSFFGVVYTNRENARVLDVAISLSAVDFNYDNKAHADYDLSLLDEFETRFPPLVENRVLSGFHRALYPNADLSNTEYREPNASIKYLPSGLIFNSDRGDVEAAVQILQLILDHGDHATVWWSGLPNDGELGAAGVIRIKNGEVDVTVIDDFASDRDAAEVSSTDHQWIGNYQELLGFAAGLAGLCCPSPFSLSVPRSPTKQ